MSRYQKPRHRNLIGQRFGRLLVLELAPGRTSTGGVIWLCLCDCGKKVTVRAQSLPSGHTVSCGCQLREKAAQHIRTVRSTNGRTCHGHARHGKQSRTYRSWKGAKNRCFNVNESAWIDWGGRGISMCERWRISFPAFLADMGECPPGMSLDRINNDGNYEPSNCRWATNHEQRLNQRPKTKHSRIPTHWLPEEHIEALLL